MQGGSGPHSSHRPHLRVPGRSLQAAACVTARPFARAELSGEAVVHLRGRYRRISDTRTALSSRPVDRRLDERRATGQRVGTAAGRLRARLRAVERRWFTPRADKRVTLDVGSSFNRMESVSTARKKTNIAMGIAKHNRRWLTPATLTQRRSNTPLAMPNTLSASSFCFIASTISTFGCDMRSCSNLLRNFPMPW